jgi:small subunit ribosomal protein S7|nr:30S ribosomal protein S7 [Picochlorum sp. 'soloecismus']
MDTMTLYTSPYTYADIRHKAIHLLTRGGRESRAHSLWRETMGLLGCQAEIIVHAALEKCSPAVEVRRVRVAGTTYYVPKLVTYQQAYTRGLRWILQGATRRRQQSSAQALAQEFMDAAQGTGWAYTQCMDIHRLAEANRAYSRYQWWR